MKYKSILPFIGEYAVVSIEGDKYGVIDRSAQVVIPPIWDMIDYVGGDIIAVCKGFCRSDIAECENNEVWSIRSLSGRYVTPKECLGITPWSDSKHFSAIDRDTKLYGIVDTEGNVIIPFEYNFLSEASRSDWVYATKDGKSGYITLSGEIAIPIIYDSISPIFREHPDDWFTVEKDGECYYINQKGERILL